jgi:hypothetical protein
MRIINLVKNNRGVLLEALIILIVALVPRLYGIGLFLTADEKNWVNRSAEFIKAWRHLRINDTLQTTHPGITVLWVSGLAVYTAQLVYQTVFNMNDILKFAAFAQVPMAVINSLLVVAIFIVLRKLLPRSLAFIAGLALALDPYLIGFSKIVHVDAFLTGFLAVAVLLLILYDKNKSKKIYWLSAFFAGLAILTKIPAIAVLPFAGILFAFRNDILTKHIFWKQLKLYGGWLVIVAVVVALFWPSLLWVSRPLDNISQVGKDMKVATLQPHDMDEPYSMEAWHYPATLLTRSTISVVLGFVVLVSMLCFRKTREKIFQIANWRVLFFLSLFVLIFMVEMTIGAKKGDRYVLPVFPAITILGCVGIYGAVAVLNRNRLSKNTQNAVVAVLILASAVVALIKLGPYELAYYNPLFPPNMSQELGWGEGFDKVAKFLDAQPDKNYVASWYPDELGALTKKTVLTISAYQENRMGYVVLYRNMFGRNPDHWANDFLDEYYKKRKPIFTAYVNGLEYAWVYRQPVVTAIVGEILPKQTLVLQKKMNADNLSAISFAVATYSGKAKAGTMTVHVREQLDGQDLRAVTVPVTQLQDGGLTKFKFEPLADILGKDLYFIVTTDGTFPTNAPTLRVAKDEPNFTYALVKDGPLSKKALIDSTHPGWIGVDWYFIRDGKELSQLEVK